MHTAEQVTGDTLFAIFNARLEAVSFRLPSRNPHQQWELLFDTANDDLPAAVVSAGHGRKVEGLSSDGLPRHESHCRPADRHRAQRKFSH